MKRMVDEDFFYDQLNIVFVFIRVSLDVFLRIFVEIFHNMCGLEDIYLLLILSKFNVFTGTAINSCQFKK